MTRNKFKFFICPLSVVWPFSSFSWLDSSLLKKKTKEKRFLLVDFSVKSFYKLRLEFHDIDDFLFERTHFFHPKSQTPRGRRMQIFTQNASEWNFYMNVHPRGEWNVRKKWHFGLQTRCAMLDCSGSEIGSMRHFLCWTKNDFFLMVQ